MMISRIVTMGSPPEVQSRWLARCLLLLVVLAGQGVGDLVDSVLDRALGLVDAPFVLEASVSGQRAGSFLHAPFCFVDVLVGHEPSLLVVSPVRAKLGGSQIVAPLRRPAHPFNHRCRLRANPYRGRSSVTA